MADVVGSAEVEIRANAAKLGADIQKQVVPALNSSKKAADGLGKSVDEADKSAERLSKTAKKIGVALGGAAVAGFFKNATFAASDLNETLNVTGLVFGEAQDQAVAFAEASAGAIGQSKTAALEAQNSVGGLLKNLGFAAEETTKWSQDLTVLAADIGSAFNVESADAIAAIGSGLRGETEPLRRFNVFLSQEAIAAEAVSKGFAVAGQELDKYAKAQAALSLITQQTSIVSGDFGNTLGESLPNQLKVLKAEFEDTVAEIGQNFLPTALELVVAIREDALPAFQRIATVIGVTFSQSLSTAVPLLKAGAQALEGFAAILERIPQPILNLSTNMLVFNRLTGTFAAGAAAGAKSLTKLSTSLAEGANAWPAASGAAAGLSRSLGGLATALPAIGAVAAIGFTAFGLWQEGQKEAAKSTEDLTEAIIADTKAINENAEAAAIASFFETRRGSEEFLQTLQDLNVQLGAGESAWSVYTDAVQGNEDAQRRIFEALESTGGSIEGLTTFAKSDILADALKVEPGDIENLETSSDFLDLIQSQLGEVDIDEDALGRGAWAGLRSEAQPFAEEFLPILKALVSDTDKFGEAGEIASLRIVTGVADVGTAIKAIPPLGDALGFNVPEGFTTAIAALDELDQSFEELIEDASTFATLLGRIRGEKIDVPLAIGEARVALRDFNEELTAIRKGDEDTKGIPITFDLSDIEEGGGFEQFASLTDVVGDTLAPLEAMVEQNAPLDELRQTFTDLTTGLFLAGEEAGFTRNEFAPLLEAAGGFRSFEGFSAAIELEGAEVFTEQVNDANEGVTGFEEQTPETLRKTLVLQDAQDTIDGFDAAARAQTGFEMLPEEVIKAMAVIGANDTESAFADNVEIYQEWLGLDDESFKELIAIDNASTPARNANAAVDGFQAQPNDSVTLTVNAETSAVDRALTAIQSIISATLKPINVILDIFANLPGSSLTEGADGGIFTRATPMLIGEAGAEVLIPLTNPQRALELSQASGLLDVLATGRPAAQVTSEGSQGTTALLSRTAAPTSVTSGITNHIYGVDARQVVSEMEAREQVALRRMRR